MQSLILRLLAIACILFALGSMAMTYHRRHLGMSEVATVNGEPITQDEFFTALKLAAGSRVLEELVDQRTILQEAKKDNVTLADADIKPALDAINKQTKDPSTRKLLGDQARARLLIKKIVLKDVDDAARHKFYDTFKDDLVQYDLAALVPSAPEDADAIEHDLKAGKSFEQVADTYPNRLGTMAHGQLGVQSARTIASVLGDEALKEIKTLQPGHSNATRFKTRGEPLFVKLNAIKSSYDDVKPEIDDILGDAGEAALMDRLATDRKIVSPYITVDASASPAASESPASSDLLGTPAPIESAAPSSSTSP